MQTLTRTTHLLQLVLLAALWATSFLVHIELFEGIVTAKQRGVEIAVLFTLPLLIAGTLLFYLIKKQHPKEKLLTVQDESTNPLALNPGLVVGLQGALISLLVFSLFSYPFDISSFMLQLVVAIAVLSRFSMPIVELQGSKKLLAILPLSLLVFFTVVHFVPQRTAYYQALKTWQQADRLYNIGAYNSAVEAYEEVASTLKAHWL